MSDRAAPSPLERWSLRLSRVGLLVIVAVTFATSFDAVSAVAVELGAVNPDLAWTIPLAIDGMIVSASAIAWVESLRGERWHPFPVVLVAAAGALSVAANVAHADGGQWLAPTLAGVPPAFLIAAVELGSWQIRRDVNRAAATHGVQPATDDVQAAHDGVAAARVPQGDVHAALRQWLARNPGATPDDAVKADIARLAQVSPSTVSRRWADLVDAVQPSTNGAHA